jgi:hypothetical protein
MFSNIDASLQVEDDPALDTRDVPGLLAKMMMDEAAKQKKQDALKADVLKVRAQCLGDVPTV